MKVLVTGAAGFIGYHVCKNLLDRGCEVIGFDNLNSYYDKSLKENRIKNIYQNINNDKKKFNFEKNELSNINSLKEIFKKYKPNYVINLAAQAGVRYSIEKPESYIKANLVGFANVLECCRKFKIDHLIYASSSSVYGGNTNLPFNENQSVDHPVSLYAATKKSNELMAHCYSHLYNIPTTGLRFFTVYGPWGRPDMALFLFTKAILRNEPIKVFNNGNMIRDFTYIDDIVNSIFLLINKIPKENKNFDRKYPSPSSSWAPYRVLNIGNSNPIPLMEYISAIEECLGIKAKINYMEMQPGDVEKTSADTSSLENLIKFKPSTTIKEGVSKFIKWYRMYYDV